MRPFRLRVLPALWASLWLLAPLPGLAAPAKRTSTPAADAAAQTTHQVNRGIVSHGEHLADFVLTGSVRPYARFVDGLIAQIDGRKIHKINEKVDGSPSVVMGIDRGRPFVAYKGELERKKLAQRLIHDEAEADALFAGSDALRTLYRSLIRHAAPQLARLIGTPDERYLFQGDLLFTEDSDRKVDEPHQTVITPNQVAYVVGAQDPSFAAVRRAKVGFVIHTAAEKIEGADGRTTTQAVEQTGQVERFVEQMRSDDVFAIHPFRDVDLVHAKALSAAQRSAYTAQLATMVEKVEGLPDAFFADWNARYLARFRVYLNSYLRAPHTGGLYKAAASEEDFEFEKLRSGFSGWLARRAAEGKEPASLASGFGEFAGRYPKELETLWSSYFEAVRLQARLSPHMSDALRSKLGGGPVEGIMLRQGDHVAKWVDRLGFTLANNNARNQGATAAPSSTSAQASSTFGAWQPNTAYVVMKGQPIQPGHVAMIKEAMRQQRGVGKVVVVLSDNAPNLTATHWRDLGAAKTRTELAARDYTYLFDVDLRKRMLKSALGESVEVVIADTADFWRYVNDAKQANHPGKIRFVVGAKEMEQRRYDAIFQSLDSHLAPLVVDMQEDGISATQVRAALKQHVLAGANGPLPPVLAHALSVFAEGDREAFLREMVQRWRAVDDAAAPLVAAKPAKRK